MDLKFKLLFSDLEFEVYQIGAWQFTRTQTESEWEHVGIIGGKEWMNYATNPKLLRQKNKLSYSKRKRVA